MKKVICTWKNGVTKEIEVNCKSASVVAIAEIKIWCEKNNFAYPEFKIV